MHRVAALGVFLSLLALPSLSRAEGFYDGVRLPPGAEREVSPQAIASALEPLPSEPSRRRLSRIMMTRGAALLVLGYGLNAFFGFGAGYNCVWFSCEHDDAWTSFREMSLIPVIGPFAQLVLLPDASAAWVVGLVLTGGAQALGFGLLIAGLVRRLAGEDGAESGSEAPALVVAPAVTPTDAGMIVEGRF